MLIDTILDSARVEAGELEVSPEPTHVGDVVMSSVLEARDLAVGTDVKIQGEVQPGMPTLLVDGTRIVQALTAVVMTAARFTDKGVVPVRATLPDTGERLRIEVETSGEGLPVGEREKIFDAFKSAESARRHGGLGLGLQLARSILEIHGGTIEVDNTDRGGMVFRVWLPVRNDRASIRARASKPTTLPPTLSFSPRQASRSFRPARAAVRFRTRSGGPSITRGELSRSSRKASTQAVQRIAWRAKSRRPRSSGSGAFASGSPRTTAVRGARAVERVHHLGRVALSRPHHEPLGGDVVRRRRAEQRLDLLAHDVDARALVEPASAISSVAC